MAEKGLPRVTSREVAERAGVQPALVNYHFGSKEGLLRAVVALVATETLEGIRGAAALEGDVAERLRGLARAVVGQFSTSPYAPRLMFEQVLFGEESVLDEFVEHFARPNLETITSLLEAGVEAGEVREVEPLFLVPSLIGSIVFFFLAEPILRRLFGMEEITPELAERFAEHAAELVLHGIATPRGRPS
jgi:AcrR family transcriptional regulator